MKGVDMIEFYLDGADKYIARVESSVRLPIGGLVSIRGKTYEVKQVTWAVDHSNDFSQTAMRCNIDVIPYKGQYKRKSVEQQPTEHK